MTLENFNLKQALKNSHFIGGWETIDDAHSQNIFNHELIKEVDIGHELYQIDLMAIIKNSDDVIYQFVNDTKIASVHLTFCSGKDKPPFPLCQIYDDLNAWYEEEYFPSLVYPLNQPEMLNQFEQIVMAYALNMISNQDFEQYIYGLDTNNLPFNGMDYIDLISLNFNDKENIILFLNQWYKQVFIVAEYDLMDFYTLNSFQAA